MSPLRKNGVSDLTEKQLTDDEMQEYLEQLRNLIINNLRISTRQDDPYLLRFLHSTDFRVEDAFKKLKLFNELKTENTEWFANSHPVNYSNLMAWKTKAILKGRDKFGRPIYLTKMSAIEPSKTTLLELVRFDDLWIESILDDPETQMNGICAIIDLSGYSWKMFRWLTPGNVRMSARKIELLPIKKIVIHIIKSSVLLNAAVALVFPFLSDAIKEHIHFHYEDWTSLQKYIDPEYLPEEYGGKLKFIDFEAQNKWLLDQGDILLEKFRNDNRL